MTLGPLLDAIVDRALAEDLAGGDPTSEAIVPETARAIGRAIARSPLVVAGGEAFARTFYRVDAGVRVERCLPEGAPAAPGDVLWLVEGATRSLLAAERTALNFAQRLAGTATLTARFVARIPGDTRLVITDTRKTAPGLRVLQREAVRAGGGHNHRNDLGAAVLIKDNHIAAAGGIRQAIERARRRVSHTAKLEVEVETLDALDEALAAGADSVLLDNFPPEIVKSAVERTAGRALVEVSGGVGEERIAELARAGVDVVSIGALTHSAPSADISFEIEPLG